MQHSFWHQRWQEDRIGFHLPETNAILEKHLDSLQLAAADKIFVPLCGKSLDLLFLNQKGFKVLGNELSSVAVNAFFNESHLPFTTKAVTNSQEQELITYQSSDIEIIQGDFFALNKHFIDDINAVYDRASMVALPEQMRKKYVRFLLDILPQKIKILLITLEYDQNLKQGPPFSVSEQEIYQSYGDDFDIHLLETQQTPMKQRGEVSKQISMSEKIYLLQR